VRIPVAPSAATCHPFVLMHVGYSSLLLLLLLLPCGAVPSEEVGGGCERA
jgi:hypothetical protein